MCARTPIWCPTCRDTLLWTTFQQAGCRAGHTFGFDAFTVGPGQQITTQYHGAGRSQLMVRTECQRCGPL